jgi:predicted ester cyclase
MKRMMHTLSISALIAIAAVLCSAATETAAQTTDDLDRNKEFVRRLITVGYNERNQETIDALQAEGYIAHENGVTSNDGIWHEIETNRARVPDFNLTIKKMIAEDNIVVSLVDYKGTHAQFSQDISIQGAYIHRLENGKIAEAWIVYDLLGTALHCGFTLTPPQQSDKAP